MAATNDLTRQQLDELDSLLQQMLKPKVAAAVEPQQGWRADPPANAAAPHLTEMPRSVESIAPLPPMPLPDVSAAMPFAPSPMLPVERPPVVEFTPPAPAPLEEFARLDLAVLTPAEEPKAEAFEPVVKPLPAWLWPLFAVNWLLESVLKLFGPPGQAFTGRTGKNLLGTAGLMMIIGAGLWTAQSRGWLHLPIPR